MARLPVNEVVGDEPPVAEGARLDDIEAAYRAGYRRFLRVAIAIVGDQDVAADAVHDAFVRAVRHKDSFTGSGSIEAWLWRTVVNAARDSRHGEAKQAHMAPNGETTAASANGHEDDQEIRVLLRALPERQRLALFLRYYADLDYAAIGETLGIQPGTVAATLHAAHMNLRERIKEA